MKKFFLLCSLTVAAYGQQAPIIIPRVVVEPKPYTGMTAGQILIDKYKWQAITDKPYVAPAFGPRSVLQIYLESK